MMLELMQLMLAVLVTSGIQCRGILDTGFPAMPTSVHVMEIGLNISFIKGQLPRCLC